MYRPADLTRLTLGGSGFRASDNALYLNDVVVKGE
jgi:hypothetical protein